jgi:hypothetical protein
MSENHISIHDSSCKRSLFCKVNFFILHLFPSEEAADVDGHRMTLTSMPAPSAPDMSCFGAVVAGLLNG